MSYMDPDGRNMSRFFASKIRTFIGTEQNCDICMPFTAFWIPRMSPSAPLIILTFPCESVTAYGRSMTARNISYISLSSRLASILALFVFEFRTAYTIQTIPAVKRYIGRAREHIAVTTCAFSSVLANNSRYPQIANRITASTKANTIGADRSA